MPDRSADSARARREIYVGPWLPEPIPDADALSPERHTELADDLSFALLLALDRLSPSERAAFLLHDVFDAPFSEIAATLAEKAFEWLDAPVFRVTAPDTPIPFAPSLEAAYLPGLSTLLAAARRLAAY